jgi:hypothetical protein
MWGNKVDGRRLAVGGKLLMQSRFAVDRRLSTAD